MEVKYIRGMLKVKKNNIYNQKLQGLKDFIINHVSEIRIEKKL